MPRKRKLPWWRDPSIPDDEKDRYADALADFLARSWLKMPTPEEEAEVRSACRRLVDHPPVKFA